MIIFGIRGRTTPQDAGTFRCPRCQSRQPYQRMAYRPWFTLYFLPVLPLGSGEESVACLRCGSCYEPQVLNNFDPAATRHGVVERGADPFSAERGVDPFLPGRGADPFFPEPALASSRPVTTSGFAVASLITALVSIVFLPIGASVITSLAAIITGHLSLAKIRRSAGRLSGRGMAIIGTTVGYVLFAGSVIVLSSILQVFQNRPPLADRAEADRRPPLARPADAAAPVVPPPAPPEVPALDGPGAPEPEMPWLEVGLAEVDIPEVEIPEVEIPEVEVPEVEVSEVEVPEVEVPEVEVPEVEVPEVEVPEVDRRPEFAKEQFEAPMRGEPAPAFRAALAAPPVDRDRADSTEPLEVERPGTGSERPRLARVRGSSPDVVRVFPDMGWGVDSLAFAPNGRWLAAGKMDGELLVLDIETGATRGIERNLRDLSQVAQVAFSDDGQYLAAAGSSGQVRVWSVARGGALGDSRTLRQHAHGVGCLAISPAAPFLITGSRQGDLIWQKYRGDTTQSQQQDVVERGAMAVHLPKSGMRAAVTDGRVLTQLDLESAEVIRTRRLRSGAAHAAAFSDDGAKLAISSGYDVEIFDTAGAAPVTTLEADHEIQWSVAFLPGGRRLVTGGRGRATLWDLARGEVIRHFDLGGVLYIQTLAVSPDGRLLAAIPASAGQSLTVLRLPQ